MYHVLPRFDVLHLHQTSYPVTTVYWQQWQYAQKQVFRQQRREIDQCFLVGNMQARNRDDYGVARSGSIYLPPQTGQSRWQGSFHVFRLLIAKPIWEALLVDWDWSDGFGSLAVAGMKNDEADIMPKPSITCTKVAVTELGPVVEMGEDHENRPILLVEYVNLMLDTQPLMLEDIAGK